MGGIGHVWVVDDDRSIRWVLERALKKSDIDVTAFDSASGVITALQTTLPDAIITDIRMPGMDGLDLLHHLQHDHPELPVIIMTAHSDLGSAVSAYQGGAFEYLPKPFDIQEAVDLTRKACLSRKHHPQPGTSVSKSTPEIIGEAPAMQEVFRAIGRLSNSNITVLINGDSGTGKELVAQALHRHGPRANMPFIAINTAAIPRDLLESELFGHEKGAFTGAQSLRHGRFEQADRGTLFLDEIGDMPQELQTRLLRVLSDGEFYRVGGHTPLKADVRIIAATHQDLEERVREGRFREDLLHRLNVIRIHVPSVRERRVDIPLLLNQFLAQAATELNVEAKTLLPEPLTYLCNLDWPGNVRQIQNTCRWLTVMASGRQIHMEDLPRELRETTVDTSYSHWQDMLSQWATNELSAGRMALLDKALPQFEKTMIEVAMRSTGGKRQEAAKLLGWGRNTLTRKIQELGLYQSGEEDDV